MEVRVDGTVTRTSSKTPENPTELKPQRDQGENIAVILRRRHPGRPLSSTAD